MSYQIAKTIDAVGSFCPGPLMELVRAVKEADVGSIIELLSSDKGSVGEIPKWCEKAGHELVEVVDVDDKVKSYRVKIGEKKKRRRRKKE